MFKGSIVTINFGPFAGLNGVLISMAPPRAIVRILLKGRSILVEVDQDMIRIPADKARPSTERSWPA